MYHPITHSINNRSLLTLLESNIHSFFILLVCLKYSNLILTFFTARHTRRIYVRDDVSAYRYLKRSCQIIMVLSVPLLVHVVNVG